MVTAAGRRSPRRRLPGRLVSCPSALRICDRPPPPLDTPVVQRPTPPIPAALSSRSLQAARQLGAGALRPLITMTHLGGRDPSRGLQGVETHAHSHGPRHGPGADVTPAPIPDRHHGDQPCLAPDRGAVRPPDLRPSGHRHTPSSIGIDAMSWRRLAGTGFGRARLQAPRGQQPCHPCVVDHVPWRASPGGHPAPALQGGPRLRFIPPAPALEVFQTLPCGHLVNTGPGYPHEGTRPSHADLRVSWLDHAAPGLR